MQTFTSSIQHMNTCTHAHMPTHQHLGRRRQRRDLVLALVLLVLGQVFHEVGELRLDVDNGRPRGRHRPVLPRREPTLDHLPEGRGDPRVVVAREALDGNELGLLEGHVVLVHDQHLAHVDALVVHGVVVRLVQLDGAGQVDEARGVRGPVAVEVPQRPVPRRGWLARDPVQVQVAFLGASAAAANVVVVVVR
jgi:hypothetical protein